jgi:hypothetical protein
MLKRFTRQIKKSRSWMTGDDRVRRLILKPLCIIAGIFGLMFLAISPLSKYLIEKYDERYTGREITLDWAYVNPFTGYVYLHNLKIFESKKDTLFFSAKGVSGDFSILSLLSNTIELSVLTVTQPHGIVIRNNKHLNFDDLIVRFSPDHSLPQKKARHFNLLRIKILHGDFYYREKAVPINYLVKDLSMDCSGIRWDADTIASVFSFLSQNGKGGMKGNFTINVANQDYRLVTTVRDFDLEIIRQYIWELINYGVFSAQLNARIKARGNFKNAENINLSGRFSFKDFHLGKSTNNDYAAFKKLLVVINVLSPMDKKFRFDSIILSHPFLKYEIFDSLDNVQMLVGKRGSNISDVTSQSGRFNLIIEIGRYLKKLSKHFFESNYQVNRLAVSDGDLKFSDFSLNEQFTVEASTLSVRADSLSKNNKRVNGYIRSGIKPYGDLSVNLSINPRDSGDFDMEYHLNKIPVSVFNPYLISFSSFPLDRGTFKLEGIWNVRDGKIKSVNHLVIIDPRVARRIENKDLKWIPLPLIMAFVNERGNVIDYEIPISGNLKNPHFHLHDVVTDLLRNIFIKPVTISYGIALRNSENMIERALTLKWSTRQYNLSPKQKKWAKKISLFLDKNPETSIAVYPRQYSVKEREYIVFFEAKKKYVLSLRDKNAQTFSHADSLFVEKMSIKDPLFMHAVKKGKGAGDTLLFSIQEKCLNYVGKHTVDQQYKKLVEKREKEFLSMFYPEGSGRRVKMFPSENVIPFDGFSYFKIDYSGDLPEYLRKAYDKMNLLDDEMPRRKYFK